MFIKQYLVIDDHPTVQVEIPDPVLDRQTIKGCDLRSQIRILPNPSIKRNTNRQGIGKF